MLSLFVRQHINKNTATVFVSDETNTVSKVLFVNETDNKVVDISADNLLRTLYGQALTANPASFNKILDFKPEFVDPSTEQITEIVRAFIMRRNANVTIDTYEL